MTHRMLNLNDRRRKALVLAFRDTETLDIFDTPRYPGITKEPRRRSLPTILYVKRIALR